MTTATKQQRQQFEEQGYLVVRHALDGALVKALVDAVVRIIDRAVEGEFDPAFRWIDQEKRLPDVMNDLLGPQKYDPVFGQFFDNVTLPFVETLLDTRVRCSWLTLFTSAANNPYSTPLHRDNNGMGCPDERELLKQYHMQQCYFQAPLLADDGFLQVVPCSHQRAATEAEIAASACGWDGEQLPGLITVELSPGDVVYRHTNMLHRGWNPKGLPRWTLISSLWAAGVPMLEIERQDHGALCGPGFLDRLSPRLRTSVQRYLEAFQQNSTLPAESR